MTDSTGYPSEGWPKRDAALWYAAQGWRVGPLHTPYKLPSGEAVEQCSCGKRDQCRDIGKHPRTMHGLKDFSSDAEVVAGWWDIWPDANIGVATGYPFAFVVDEDILDAIADYWPDEVEALADVPIVRQETPNGTHFLFDPKPDDFGNSTGGRGRSLGAGIDTRGDGGYILAAPSETPSGRYRWRSDPRGPWPSLPEPMAEALRPVAYSGTVERGNQPSAGGADDARIARYVAVAVDASARELAATPEGTRNHALNEVAFRLGTLGARGDAVLPAELAYEEMASAWNEAWAEHHGVPLGSASEWESFRKTFWSGWNAGMLRPREPWPPADRDDSLPSVGFAGPLVDFGAADAAVAEAGAPLNWGEFLARDLTKAEWLAGDLFERGQQVALVGAGKAGKSLLAFELAQAVASGRPYLGAPGRPPAVNVYLDAENGHRDIQQRALAFGFTAEDLAGVVYYSFPHLPPLDTRDGGRALMALVTGAAGDVVWLDTVSRMIEGPENDSDTWLNLYRYSLLPLKRAGVATVRLDHFGKEHDRGARGSSAKTQDVDHVWTLTKNEGGSLALRRTHSRTGLGREELALIRHGEQSDDGWLPGQTRHVVSDVGFRPTEWLWRVEASKRLDEIGVARDAGLPTVRAALAGLEIRAGKARMEDLVRWRKSGRTDE